MAQASDLANKYGFWQARVDVKVNSRSELVVALLIPPRTPDEWGPLPGVNRRETARFARQERG
jgi:hypothetical protein